MIFSGFNAQVGINTSSPTATLDINGALRIRSTPESTSLDDINLVIDANGNVGKQLNARRGIFRGYLNADFITGATGSSINKILNWNEIDDPNGDFTPATGIFVAPVSGLYEVVITTTIITTDTTNVNYVVGLAGDNNKWVMRFSITDEYIEGADSNAGGATSFIGVVHLTEGNSYHFGTTNNTKILSNPSGGSGSGLGTFFAISLIKSD